MTRLEKKQLDADRKFRRQTREQSIKFRDRIAVVKADGRKIELPPRHLHV